MSDDPPAPPSRVGLAELGGGRFRVVVDERMVGPRCTERAAKGIRKWLEEGALDDLEGGRSGGGIGDSKLVRALSSVDEAFDQVSGLIKHGFK